MPLSLFGRSFSPGRSPPRRSSSLSSLRRESDKAGQDLAQEFGKIRLNIGGQNATFEDGEWVAGEQRERLIMIYDLSDHSCIYCTFLQNYF